MYDVAELLLACATLCDPAVDQVHDTVSPLLMLTFVGLKNESPTWTATVAAELGTAESTATSAIAATMARSNAENMLWTVSIAASSGNQGYANGRF